MSIYSYTSKLEMQICVRYFHEKSAPLTNCQPNWTNRNREQYGLNWWNQHLHLFWRYLFFFSYTPFVSKLDQETWLCQTHKDVFFKLSALWVEAFYKSICPSVCPSVCLFTFEVPFENTIGNPFF